MAGYVTRGNNIYDGAHKAGVALTNGLFVTIDSNDAVVLNAAPADTILRVAPDGKEDLWGMEALRLDVVSVGADEVFFVENEWDINIDAAYNSAEYAIKVDDLVKMKRLLPGEQILVTVPEALYSSVSVGGKVQPGANGLIVAVSGT